MRLEACAITPNIKVLAPARKHFPSSQCQEARWFKSQRITRGKRTQTITQLPFGCLACSKPVDISNICRAAATANGYRWKSEGGGEREREWETGKWERTAYLNSVRGIYSVMYVTIDHFIKNICIAIVVNKRISLEWMNRGKKHMNMTEYVKYNIEIITS